MQSHHLAVAALAEQRQANLRQQADQARLARSHRLARGLVTHSPLALAAGAPPSQPLAAEAPQAGITVRLITGQQLKTELDAGQPIKLVMTAGPWQVRAKHIPGTLELASPKQALRELRPEDLIVVYAIDDRLQSSAVAREALTAHGYRDVRRYAGGLRDWETAGYPVEGHSLATVARRRWPHGHSPHGRELQGGCPHCDQGWSGAGWPTTDTSLAGPQPGPAMVNPIHYQV